MSGFNTYPVTTRIFVTWPPGSDTPHETRLAVSKYVSEQLEPDGAGHQFDYNDMVVGIARNDPARHMKLKGLLDRAREMAGCHVHIWVALSVVPDLYHDSVGPVAFSGMTEIGEIDMSRYGGGDG